VFCLVQFALSIVFPFMQLVLLFDTKATVGSEINTPCDFQGRLGCNKELVRKENTHSIRRVCLPVYVHVHACMYAES